MNSLTIGDRLKVDAESLATLAGQERIYDNETFDNWLRAKLDGTENLAQFYERRFRNERGIVQEAPMNSAHPDLKKKAKHELKEMLEISLYLAFFFFALAVYDMLLLNQYHVENWNFFFALINALVITKVIMLGEYAKLGRMHENRPLIISAVWKALIFGLLVYAFHIAEEAVKRLVHGDAVSSVPREIRLDQLAARSIVVFCLFVPLFGFRELRRVMGVEKFRTLVFGSRWGNG